MQQAQQAQEALDKLKDVSDSMPENLPTTLPSSDDAMGALHKLKEIITQTFTGQQQAWPEQIQFFANQHFIECTLLVIFGVLCLIWGWRIFKPLVVINFILAGAMLGGMGAIMLEQEQYWFVGSAIGAVILGILAWPLFKAFVAFIGMLFGALIGNAVFLEIIYRCGRDDLAQYPWLGAVIGAIVFSVMAISFLKPTIILLTSLQGSMMLAAGVFGLACKIDSIRPDLVDTFSANPVIAQIIIAVVAVLGIILQTRARRSAASDNAETKKAEE